MNLTEILDRQASKAISLEEQKPLSTAEQYILFYTDAVFRFLRTFEYCRLQQVKLAAEKLSSPEFFGRERQCVLAIESAYTYIHRIEKMVRPGKGQLHDIESSTIEPSALSLWLNELRFMSEIRNKVIEHAPENLTFHSKWGQIFDCSDPFSFRLWILHPDAVAMLNGDGDINAEIERACAKIWESRNPSSDPVFGKLFDIVDGASHLDATMINSLFKNALNKLGCISNPPTILAAKISNLYEMVFARYRHSS